MSSKGLEMLRKHLSYYDFDPDKVVLLGNVLYYAKKAEFEFAGLEAENAKLRELVGDMWNYITEPVGKRNNLKERLARLDDIGDRMSELGIEVDV